MSFVEVLVSLVIFSVALLGSSVIILQNINLARQGLYKTKAVDLASMQQEAIVAYGLQNSSTWKKQVAKALPKGEGRITQAKGPFENTSLIQIDVLWHPQKSVHFEFLARDP